MGAEIGQRWDREVNQAPSPAQKLVGSEASPASCLLASGVARLRPRPDTLRSEKSLTHQDLSSVPAPSDVGTQRKTFCVDTRTGSPWAWWRPGSVNDPEEILRALRWGTHSLWEG